MPAGGAPPSLDAPLPEPALGGGLWGSYARFPVFGRAWLLRRTVRFASVLASLGGTAAVVLRASGSPLPNALWIAAHFLVGGLVLSSLGPALATRVRHRRLPREREVALVLAALALGTVGSFFVDHAVSTAIERRLAMVPASVAPDDSSPLGLVLGLLVYALFGGWLALGRYFQELRGLDRFAAEHAAAERAEEQRRLDARLALLQARVEPHFLFNALASIRSLIATDPGRASAAVDALADYLRAAIPRLREDAAALDSTLGQQLDMCKSYLEMMRVRMGDRFTFRAEVEAACRDVAFPPLVLLTLVENAIKHGIEPKRGPASVTLRAAALGPDRVAVEVEDDGVGLGEGFGTGVGLGHVLDALETRYGRHATFSLTGAPGAGTKAAVVVPRELPRAPGGAS